MGEILARAGRLALAAVALYGCILAPAATAAIPRSLKDACGPRDAADGDTSNGRRLPFFLCDDGVPAAGGTTPNPGALRAVAVPQRYAGHRGLPAKVRPADPDSGADASGNIALDADVSLPDPAVSRMPRGGYPLIVMMHGCCSGWKRDSESDTLDAPGSREGWHYNNAWFASRGYVVLTYTARGFVDSDRRGSTGRTQIDDRRYEINDFQHLAGQLADTSFRVAGRRVAINPRRVAVTGGSYGGGFSWLALTDPTWRSPGGKRMRLAAAAPKYGWTDLVYSLVPNGRHLRDRLPPVDGSGSTTPLGFPKRSIVAGLYVSGTTGIPTSFRHATFPRSIDEAFLCQQSGDPFEANPLCTSTLQTLLPSFIAHRSAYYQNDFFARLRAGDRNARVPLFSAGTLTDPLFTAVEHRRMVERIRSIDPGYPVQEYYGDYNHFVQDKRKEFSDLCGADHHVCELSDYPGGDLNARPSRFARLGVTTRLNRLLDHYLRPPGNPDEPRPAREVTASLQICPDNATSRFPLDEPGERFAAPTFNGLAPARLRLEMGGVQTTIHRAVPNHHAVSADPVRNSLPRDRGGNDARCPVEPAPGGAPTAGAGVATYDSGPLGRDYIMLGRTRVTVPHTGVGSGIQLNARLYDLFPEGKQVMVDRGVRRVTSPNGTTVLDLNGNGWRFPRGHRVRIELAQDDDPYVKQSTQFSQLTLRGVALSIPVRADLRRALSLSVSPTSTRTDRRTRFRFLVTTMVDAVRRPVPGATVTFAGAQVTTDGAGRAEVVRRFASPGRRTATATKPGLRSATAAVRIRRAGGPGFTG